ncbi:MAG: DNA polymerase III subunit beta [Patescibacteria group bacterium]
MKLIILKNNLRNGLNTVEKATSENANLPILKNVLIKTFNNKIQLSGTNLELAITNFISGKIIEEGSITVPLATLLTITNNINDEKINLEAKNNTLLFKTDNYEAVIQGLPEDEFPIIPKIENTDQNLQINAEILKEGLLKIINTVQLSEIRPEISGILFDYQVTNLKLVGTDSFRLAEKTINENNFKSNFSKGFKIIIPLKTAQDLLKILNEEIVAVFIDSNQILFKNNDLEIISRLIDGNYPDYEYIVPKSSETEINVELEHFINAVKLVSTFSGKVSDIKISIKNSKHLEVHSANQYLGENKYLVPAKIKGPAADISFNWRYLMDGLKNFESKEIIFGVNDNNKAAILKSGNDSSYFYIVMPIKNS